MSQFHNFLHRETERSFPPNLEKESRRNRFPQTCSESCPHHQCPCHNVDHYGQACEMQWEPKENKNMPLQSKSNPNESLLRFIGETVARAFEPFYQRLARIEAQTKTPITRLLNGTPPKCYPSLAIGTNQDRICYD